MEEVASLMSLLAILLIPLLLFLLVTSIFQIIGLWKIFKKAGKNGWEAIIPYFNMWTLIEISGCKWWYFLIILGSSLLPSILLFGRDSSIMFNIFDGAGLIIYYFIIYSINYNIAKKFNKDYLYAIGITLVPFVFYPILGLGKSVFDKNVKVSPYGVIKEGEI